MKEANLGSDSVVGLPLVSTLVKPVAKVEPVVVPIGPVVDPIEPAIEPAVAVEPIVVPIEPAVAVEPAVAPALYDVENDPDIALIMEVEEPQPLELADSDIEIVDEIENPRQRLMHMRQRQGFYYRKKSRHQRRERR